MFRRSLAPILLAATVACSSSTGPSLDLGELPASITLRLGREAVIGSTAIRFHEVLEDSRCPIDGVCIWAGNAKVQLGQRSTTGLAAAVMIDLNSTLEPRSAAVGDLTITYEKLTPAPRSGHETDPKDYRLTLRVERLPVEARQ
ncbi:MAG: hypothetical protein AB7S39_23710 [Gemmatimonadales bacterium]